MSKDNSPPEKCQYPVGVFSGISLDGKKIVAGTMKCNSWTCPVCNPILRKRLYKRILSGSMSKELVNLHGIKFLTLTYGGLTARLGKSIVEMYNEMTKAFHKLIRAIKKSYGDFHYFRIVEQHKDGVPHFHVMLVGNNVIPKDILDSIRSLWCGTYRLGFVWINTIKFKNQKHAINYMLKYMSKDLKNIAKLKSDLYKKRIFTASQGALLKKVKPEWGFMKVFIGSVNDKGIHEVEIKPDQVSTINDQDFVKTKDNQFVRLDSYQERLAKQLFYNLLIKEKKEVG
jgi:hypothetical protein